MMNVLFQPAPNAIVRTFFFFFFCEENRVVVDCQLGDWVEEDLWDPAPEVFPDCPLAERS